MRNPVRFATIAGAVAWGMAIAVPEPLFAGNMNCGEALVCLLTCQKDDAACMVECGSQLDPHAAELYASLQMCILPYCQGKPPDPVCFLQSANAHCQSEYQACLDDAGCVGTCENKECGDDGCGGSCGTCPMNLICKDYQCVPCEPNCGGKECGDDGCGGSCGQCGEGQVCNEEFKCESCTPDCTGKECGDDGCGGTCGHCLFNEDCIDGKCVGCTPNCLGKECGDNGCGGMCGACPRGQICDNGICKDETCHPNCLNKECGDDGCGGSCGACGPGMLCSDAGICVKNPEADAYSNEDSYASGDAVPEMCGPGEQFIYGKCVPTNKGGNDSSGTGPCKPGEKLFFGKCVPEEKSGGGGGCSASPPSAGSTSILVILSVLALFLVRRSRGRATT